ncbi:hypothetical protein [Macrococcus armenti]|uniref:hypothetical protein n=1 Tax=Macrococcus armenti TaxID=2875764 RepID=UPI001CC9585F|nr:hypothetical protein [Macrococcus armenti]UBH16393.1 hypothetical protein LAU44_05405 [Macrococcus armenti]UBH18749.1 hypothetical protein LAU39_05415 [Macrococcus armenti]UBH21021.1 hypothetical protein LAU40_05410 [Macrococcus armenti]
MYISERLNKARENGNEKFGIIITDFEVLKTIIDELELLKCEYVMTVCDGTFKDIESIEQETKRCYRIEVKL